MTGVILGWTIGPAELAAGGLDELQPRQVLCVHQPDGAGRFIHDNQVVNPRALEGLQDLYRQLSAAQLGITVASILLGFVAEDTVAHLFRATWVLLQAYQSRRAFSRP